MKDRRGQDIWQAGKRYWLRELESMDCDIEDLRKLGIPELITLASEREVQKQ